MCVCVSQWHVNLCPFFGGVCTARLELRKSNSGFACYAKFLVPDHVAGALIGALVRCGQNTGGWGGAKLFCVKPNGETLQVSTAENGTRHWKDVLDKEGNVLQNATITQHRSKKVMPTPDWQDPGLFDPVTARVANYFYGWAPGHPPRARKVGHYGGRDWIGVKV